VANSRWDSASFVLAVRVSQVRILFLKKKSDRKEFSYHLSSTPKKSTYWKIAVTGDMT
jgi:hypothetical protein